MTNYQKMLNGLDEWEVRGFLNEVLQLADQSVLIEKPDTMVAGQILQLWADRLEESRKRRKTEEERENSVHLVFSLSDAGSLKVTLHECGMRERAQVIAFNDLFSIGPIMDLDTPAGQHRRQQWLAERFPSVIFDSLHNRDHQIGAMIQVIANIPERKSVTIWCSNNAHDQAGLHFALYLLRNRDRPIRVVNLSEACKEIAAGAETDVPPYAQGLIDQKVYKEIVRRYQKFEPLSDARRRQYESEWYDRLSRQAHTLRLWQEGQIAGAAEEELDSIIIAAVLKLQKEEIDDGFVRAGSVVVEVFERMHQLVGDKFVEYRMWRLISAGILGFKGLPHALFQYSVKVLS